MSAVSKKLMPASNAAETTAAAASASMRMPKLLQPRPTTVTSSVPILRVCTAGSSFERDGGGLQATGGPVGSTSVDAAAVGSARYAPSGRRPDVARSRRRKEQRVREDVGAQPPLYELAGRGPSEIALEDERRASTWAELEERTNAFGHGLESLGAGPGQHVALIGTNRIEFYETVLGTTRAGCVLSPLKTSWAPPAIRFVLDDAQTRVVVTDVEAGRVAAREAGIPYVDLDDVEEWLGAQDRSSFPADRAGRRMSYT